MVWTRATEPGEQGRDGNDGVTAMRRHLPPLVAALAALGIAPALVVLPVVALPAAPPHPVPGSVVSFPIVGVDPAALAAQAPSAAVLQLSRSGALGGAVSAALTRPPAVLTPQRSTKPFDLVALSWTGPVAGDPTGTATTMQVRVHEHGRWSDWNDLAPADDAPDGGSPDAKAAVAKGAPTRVTGPLMADAADGVQVRVDTPTGVAPAGLRVQLVDAGRSAADSPSTPPATAAADTSQPILVTRAQWGADESLVGGPPAINPTVKALLLHHTDTNNNYTAAQAYAEVRAVYVFHTKVRGWNDVGYNFLVDRFGRVYEGRKGSINNAIEGAHAGGFNTSTLGIAALGTFSTAKPPQAMINGIVDVMSWKSAQYGLDPRATTTLISEGTSYTKYPAGAPVSVHVLGGHRDVDLTDCPGNALYPALAAIRTAVTARMQPGLVAPRTDVDAASAGGAPIVFSTALPTVQRWWLSMTPMCSTTAVRTLSGRNSGPLTVGWNLTNDGAAPVPPGVYRYTMITSSPVGTAPTWTKDVEVLPAPGSAPAACPVARLGSPDVAIASVVAGRAAYPDSHTVVVVGSGAPLDALVAAPLSHVKGAPLLLTAYNALPAAVVSDITSRDTTVAYIVGGTGSVSPAVEAQLHSIGVPTVIRLTGRDRYESAAAVAREVGASASAAVLVNGQNGQLSDAAAVAGEAAATNRPLLLVPSTGVPSAIASAITALKVTNIAVVGSPASVPSTVLTRLSALGVKTLGRITAADRTATALAVVGAFSRPVPADRVVVVPSADNALIWAALGAAQGRLTLFTDPAAVPAPTLAWLTAHKPGSVALVGSPAVAATPLMRQLLAAKS